MARQAASTRHSSWRRRRVVPGGYAVRVRTQHRDGRRRLDADVQLTADSIPIAFHDETLERTTNGTGKVENKAYSELANLDAGFNFAQDGKRPFRGLGIRIPTIESLLKRFPHTLVTLDLKDLRTAAVQPLCVRLEKLHRTCDVYIGAENAEQVELFRKLCPDVHTSGTEMRAARAAQDRTPS